MAWSIDSAAGVFKNKAGMCLAARGKYVPEAPATTGNQLWAKPLGNGKTAALVINGGASSYTATITLGISLFSLHRSLPQQKTNKQARDAVSRVS